MLQPFVINNINNTLTCYILPRSKFPDGLYLTYESCPDTYNNQTSKLIRVCCLSIMFSLIQESFYKKTQDWLTYNSSSLLVGPSVLFNILSLIVLKRLQKYKTSETSTTFYMKCLCIFDTLTIVSKFLNEIIVVRNGLRKHPIAISSFLCKSLSFFESCFAISSIYILIAMSIDKLICVLLPLKSRQILTRFKSRLTLVGILFCSALFSSYTLFDKKLIKLESYEETTKSGLNQTNNTFISIPKYTYDCDSNWPEKKNDWILINNIIRVFLPIFLLFICNSCIILVLSRSKRHSEALFKVYKSDPSLSKHLSTTTTTMNEESIGIKLLSNNKNNNLKNPCSSHNSLTVSEYDLRKAVIKTNVKNNAKNNKNTKKDKKSSLMRKNLKNRNNNNYISFMLVTVSLGFVFLNLPFALRTLFHRQFSDKFKILDYLYHDDNLFRTTTSKNEISIAIKYEFFSSFTHFLLDLNYLANFFLYFFSGSRFRTQLWSLLSRRKEKKFESTKNFTNLHYLNKTDYKTSKSKRNLNSSVIESKFYS